MIDSVGQRAIARYAADNGLTPQLSVLPDIEFKDRAGQRSTRPLANLISEYKNKLKEDAKLRAAERRRLNQGRR